MFWRVGALIGRGVDMKINYDDRVTCVECGRFGNYLINQRTADGKYIDAVATGCKYHQHGGYEVLVRCGDFIKK